jgi:uncharacterized protein YjbJ (UPF0337 family)
MPFRDCSPFFLPEELDALTAAYEAAWQHLRLNKSTLCAQQVPTIKRKLAQIILASAHAGKLDVEELKEIALRSISGYSHWDRIARNWKLFRDEIKHKWGKLSEEDLIAINGRRKHFEVKIQERYGYAEDRVRNDVDDWLKIF